MYKKVFAKRNLFKAYVNKFSLFAFVPFQILR